MDAPHVSINPKNLLIASLALVILCLVIYGNVLRMDFVYDDIPILKEPSSVWSLKVIPRAFSENVMHAAGKETPYYRPLLIISLAIDHALWHQNPAGFHLTNLLLHILAVLLLFLLSLRLTNSLVASSIAALIFASHPVQAETVDWIAARADSICACLSMASFLLFIRHQEVNRYGYLAGSLLLFSFALLAKEMAIMLPFILLIYLWQFKKKDWSSMGAIALYGIPVLLYIGLRMSVLTAQVWKSDPLTWRLYTGLGLIVRYLQNFILPVDLRVFYDLPVQKEFMSASVLMPILLLAVMGLALALAWKHIPMLGFGMAWFFLSILPVSGFLTLLRPALMADRYIYFPAIGLCLACGAVGELVAVRWKYLSLGVLLALVCSLALLTVQRGSAWNDQPTFMRHMIADAPNTEYAHFYRGTILAAEGRYSEALKAFDRVLTLNPRLSEAYFSRGMIHCSQGNYLNAEKEFKLALLSDPLSTKVVSNLGAVYAQQGRLTEAIAQFRLALKMNPGDQFAHSNLQRALSMQH